MDPHNGGSPYWTIVAACGSSMDGLTSNSVELTGLPTHAVTDEVRTQITNGEWASAVTCKDRPYLAKQGSGTCQESSPDTAHTFPNWACGVAPCLYWRRATPHAQLFEQSVKLVVQQPRTLSKIWNSTRIAVPKLLTSGTKRRTIGATCPVRSSHAGRNNTTATRGRSEAH